MVAPLVMALHFKIGGTPNINRYKPEFKDVRNKGCFAGKNEDLHLAKMDTLLSNHHIFLYKEVYFQDIIFYVHISYKRVLTGS